MDRLTAAFGLSFSITALLSAVLVVVKETNRGIFEWMAGLTGHHWVTHGVLQLLVFVILGVIFLSRHPLPAQTLTWLISGSLMLGSAIIAGFFLLH